MQSDMAHDFNHSPPPPSYWEALELHTRENQQVVEPKESERFADVQQQHTFLHVNISRCQFRLIVIGLTVLLYLAMIGLFTLVVYFLENGTYYTYIRLVPCTVLRMCSPFARTIPCISIFFFSRGGLSFVNVRHFDVEEECKKRGEPVSICYVDANNL